MTFPAATAGRPSPTAPTWRRIPWFLAAACAWSCSPAPTPPAGAPATTATTAADTAPTTAPAVTAPGAEPTASASATPADTSVPAGGPVPDATCASCLSAPVSWGWVGGNAARRDRSTADPCRTYRRTRTFSARAGGQPPISCSAPLACDASDTGSGKLATLVSHPDVQKALASPMTVYGCDLRPVDGAIYGVEADGGRSFGVGDECKGCNAPSGACVTPPAGVQALVRFLKSLDEKMLATDPCKSALGPG